ncbi:hypothetical protein MTE01_16630 [Microbacterium testaceum]|uniref:Acetoacetate decarboxylase n=1 Tax=Microbacterium testaceum TaxID=2033 RepID=A0A4Y3QMJ2_MICTE|nr:hypothetical protein MTE01_16630 [Microbacterium testaceum]
MRVDYVTDEHAARKLLPEPLELPLIPRASVFFTQFFQSHGDIPLLEVSQSIEAISPDGSVGDYIQSVYTDNVASIIHNRDAYIQPILYGVGSLTHRDGATNFSLTVGQTVVVRGSAGYRSEPMLDQDAVEFLQRPKFYLKVLGRPALGEPAKPTLFKLRNSNVDVSEAYVDVSEAYVDVSEAYKVPATLTLDGHIMAPFDQLPVLHIDSCHTFATTWSLGELEVIHRY